mmetsp:Transcript_32816/g.50112  ORF Transcript_32816/g.50112 Transcript_32816/m.50112 type:complete len:139 (-) Transcript_32816:1234-1650(-)
MKSDLLGSHLQPRRTAREFFSKENLDHPSIEENKNLKQQLKNYREIKAKSFGFSENSMKMVDDNITSVQLQLDSYKEFVRGERERLLLKQREVEEGIQIQKSEIDSFSAQNQTITSNFSLKTEENPEDVRKQLAETSI